MKLPREIWLPVVGYETAYEVSDIGRVRSLPRTIMRRNGSPQTIVGGIRATPPLGGGYPSLMLHHKGKKTTVYVHHLVAAAFIGPRPRGKEVAHSDGKKANCALRNLRYATPVENDADKIAHGTRSEGVKNGHAKLTDDQVRKIRRLSSAGARHVDLAAVYGVVPTVILKIAKGYSWRHIL